MAKRLSFAVLLLWVFILPTFAEGLQNAVDQASQRKDSYKEVIRDLTQINRAAEAERAVSKLQKEVDRLEDELLAEKQQ